MHFIFYSLFAYFVVVELHIDLFYFKGIFMKQLHDNIEECM